MIFAGQEAGSQRAVGDHADPLLLTQWLQLAFELGPVDQAVVRLDRVVARQTVLVAGPQCLGQPPCRIVGAADIAHLALLHQIVQRAHGLVDGRAGVIEVGLVEVDVVGVQPAQAVLHGCHDVAAAQSLAVGAVPHAAANLGGQHDLAAVAACLHPAADDCLRHAAGVAINPAGVNVGSVDEVAAGLHKGIHHLKRGWLVGRPAPLHSAETKFTDLEAGAAQIAIVHCFLRSAVEVVNWSDRAQMSAC